MLKRQQTITEECPNSRLSSFCFQEKAVQSKLLGEINLHSDQDWNETHKNRLKPIWDIINSLYAPAPSLAVMMPHRVTLFTCTSNKWFRGCTTTLKACGLAKCVGVALTPQR
jgi:hypothetical protein